MPTFREGNGIPTSCAMRTKPRHLMTPDERNAADIAAYERAHRLRPFWDVLPFLRWAGPWLAALVVLVVLDAWGHGRL